MAKLDQILVKGTTYELVPEVAPLFNTATAYAVGDYVIKDAVLYRFKATHTSGSWSASQVDEVTAGSELKSIKNDKLDKNQGTANAGKYLKVGADGNVKTADLDVTTDKTLSVADKAADAKAVGDEITDLKADLSNTSQVVYKTDISSTTGLILFHAKNGDSITIKTKGGSNFIDADQLRFYDADGAMIEYWSTAPSTVNSRTFTYNKETEALYIGITQIATSVVDYVVINNSSGYNFEPTLVNVQNQLHSERNEIADLKEDLTQLNETGSFASWACGMVAASGLTNTDSNAISPLVDCSQNITIDCKSGSKFYLYFYNASGEYIGKVASDGTINTTAGSWKSFTGEVDPSEWKPSGAAYYRIALIPTDGTVLTNDNVSTWANLHCDLKYTSIDRIDQALGTSSEKTEKNLVNQLDLLSIPWSSYNAGWYSVSPNAAYSKYNGSKSPFPVREAFNVNTQYTLSFDAKYTGSVGTTLSMQFLYTDSTKSEVTVTGSAEKHYVMTSTAGKTVDSLRLSYNNSVTTDVRNLMLVEGIEEPAEFFPYDDVTAVDLVARAISKETAAKVGEMEPAVKIAVSADTGVRTSEFNVSAGTSHSSMNNQITLAVAKDEFFYCVATGIQGRPTQIWIRNDNTDISVGGIAEGIVTRFRAPINIEKIGLFLGSGTENASVTFAVFAEKSVLSRLTEKSQYDSQYLDKLLNAKRKANPGNYSSQTSPEIFTLAHFSDIHGNSWAMKQVQEFKDTYQKQLDDTICTGDVVADEITDGTAFWNDNSDGKILICIGNHDSLGSNGWANPVDQQTLYETYIEPYEANWGAEIVNGHSYWYKDYSDKKIRLIAVDATIYDSTEQANQMTWLNTALSGAITNGYAVVGAVHFPPMPANFHKIDGNFTALLHGTAGDMSQFAWHTYHTEILTAVDQFITNGGDFVCWLSGHTHYDLVSYDDRFPKQLFITISCAMPSSLFEEKVRDSARESGLVLNTVCIDTVRKYVKLIRYGAEWDDCLRHTGTCVIKYDANPPQVMFSN